MVDELRQAFEEAQQRLSDNAQRLLAAQIEAWLDEQEWTPLLAAQKDRRPWSAWLPKRANIARGDVEDGGWE